MRKKNSFWMFGLLWAFNFISVASYADLPSAKIKLDSKAPLVISRSEQGMFYPISLPVDFMFEIEGGYDSVSIQDIDADGKEEVIFRLAGNGVNSCYRISYFSQGENALKEMFFKYGGLCNFKFRKGYIISAYKYGAIWNEDVYLVKNGMAQAVLSDSCVGCHEVARKVYSSDGVFVRSLVSDSVDFEKRTPLISKVISPRAQVFAFPNILNSTKKYLMHGDAIALVGFDQSQDDESWVEFRYLGATTVSDGWLQCSAVESCADN